MGLRGPILSDQLPLYATNTTVRQTLNVLSSRRHQSSGQGGGGGTFAGRNSSRGRYSRHAEGNSIIFTVLRKFYANQVRSLQDSLLYVLLGENVLEAQMKWEKLTVYHYLAICLIPNAIYAIRCSAASSMF